ncbi:unnamed protein product, partial [Phaeothamnion confervicola]
RAATRSTTTRSRIWGASTAALAAQCGEAPSGRVREPARSETSSSRRWGACRPAVRRTATVRWAEAETSMTCRRAKTTMIVITVTTTAGSGSSTRRRRRRRRCCRSSCSSRSCSSRSCSSSCHSSSSWRGRGHWRRWRLRLGRSTGIENRAEDVVGGCHSRSYRFRGMLSLFPALASAVKTWSLSVFSPFFIVKPVVSLVLLVSCFLVSRCSLRQRVAVLGQRWQAGSGSSATALGEQAHVGPPNVGRWPPPSA